MNSQAITRMGVNQFPSISDYFRASKQAIAQARLMPVVNCWQAIIQGMLQKVAG